MKNASTHGSGRAGAMPDYAVATAVGAAVFGLLLALRPIAGVPMNDDFSYARTAEAFARTGHVVYNGWGSPMLLPQMAVGALVFKLFGFSYTVTQWFGTVLAGIAAAVLYATARACGLRRLLALLVTALVCLNPIYLGVAPSFMTDVPSLLLLLLALLALVRSLRGAGGASVRLEPAAAAVDMDNRGFVLALVLSLIAGANRQICWVAAMGAFLAAAALLPRARRRAALAVVALVIAAAAGTAWFDRQPYTVPSETGLFQTVETVALLSPEETRFLAMFLYHDLNLIGLFVFPPAAAAFVLTLAARRRPIRWLLFAAVALFGFLPVVYPLTVHRLDLLGDRYGLTTLPYGQYFTHVGSVIGAVYGWDRLPAALGPGTIAVLAILGALGMTFGGYFLFDWLERLAAERRAAKAAGAGPPLWMVAVSMAAAAAVIQVLVSLPWFATLNLFDRYLLLQLPGLLILHAAQAQAALADLRAADADAARPAAARRLALPLAAAAAVLPAILIAAIGVRFASDYFARNRARAELRQKLLARGIPETAIHAGFEFAADAQVRLAGHMNNSHVLVPEGVYRPHARRDPYLPERDNYPTLEMRYLLSTLPPDEIPPDLADPEPIDSVTFRTPLPPGEQTIYAYRTRPYAIPDEPAEGASGAPAAS